MNRAMFQRIAGLRFREAESLLGAGFPSGAYYLAGYAVECALKACIAKRVRRYDFPDRDFVKESYTHNFEILFRTAELVGLRDDEIRRDAQFGQNWQDCKEWKEDSRYNIWARAEAQKLIGAIIDADHGVLPFIQRHW